MEATRFVLTAVVLYAGQSQLCTDAIFIYGILKNFTSTLEYQDASNVSTDYGVYDYLPNMRWYEDANDMYGQLENSTTMIFPRLWLKNGFIPIETFAREPANMTFNFEYPDATDVTPLSTDDPDVDKSPTKRPKSGPVNRLPIRRKTPKAVTTVSNVIHGIEENCRTLGRLCPSNSTCNDGYDVMFCECRIGLTGYKCSEKHPCSHNVSNACPKENQLRQCFRKKCADISCGLEYCSRCMPGWTGKLCELPETNDSVRRFGATISMHISLLISVSHTGYV